MKSLNLLNCFWGYLALGEGDNSSSALIFHRRTRLTIAKVPDTGSAMSLGILIAIDLGMKKYIAAVKIAKKMVMLLL
jgi:hypothetical protein